MAYYITDQIRSTLNSTEAKPHLARPNNKKTPVITESKRDQHGVAITPNDS